MIEFVCDGMSKNRSSHYFVDSQAKMEYAWNQNTASGPEGCWKLAAGSVARRQTIMLQAKTDAKKILKLPGPPHVDQGQKILFNIGSAQLGETTTGKKTGNSQKFVANTVYECESILFMIINYSWNCIL